ncbi:hypothetical protein FKR81_22210 [Lentzea tibetensis]|uniref:Guanylate cyclase domain-containing protein n=1 Tax=Lentzea tibetensis TaxID=2591470 RepID=A0A563EQZ1_9PSEU|nr:hypothetical protein [Lentzea tibetensis]TWP49952.1 hypothetical protein FKR81_22210 [Lentzea tibetensis]
MTQPATVRDLPPYRAVVVVDMKDYSRHPGAEQQQLTETIPVVLERAFGQAGRPEIWAARRFPDSTGDGYAVGFAPEVLPFLVGPFLDSLQRELEYRDQVLRSVSRSARMRMRVAITVGPLAEAEGDGDGTGDSRVEAHRLVDADEVRRLLDESDPDVTFVAAILSDRVHRDVIAAGYAPKPATEYVRTSVSVKSYRGEAFLHVPKPSDRLLEKGFGQQQVERAEEAAAAVGEPKHYNTHNEFSGTASGMVIQAGRVGNVHQTDNSVRQHVQGNNNTVSGRDIHGSGR